jgi:CCDC81-like prokaryotic HU domain 2
MHQYLAQYLFSQQSCALPGLGNFYKQNSEAVYDVDNKVIAAPKQVICFSQKEISSKPLVEWVAKQKNESEDMVLDELTDYIEKIKSTLLNNDTATVDNIGSFKMNSSGSIVFTPNDLPNTFFGNVVANKSSNGNYNHSLINGNTHSLDKDSADYFDEETVANSKWWIWPLILSVIAICVILVYLNVSHPTVFFGNNISIF